MPQHTRLALAVALAVGAPLSASADEAHDERVELDELVITASPLRPRADDIVQPVTVLAGTALDERRSPTLGESVEQEAGVQSSYFGPGVGRPIIRGLEGPRVQVLSGGLGSLDVSTVSVDHAVTVEPFLADRIEVLRGPATLLYGSSAIGGVVNVVDGRIAEQPVDGFSGRAEVRGNSVSDERSGVFRIDGGNGRLVVHADAFYRDTDDYRVPHGAAAGHDEHDDADHDEHADRLEGSAQRNRGGALGFTWFADGGYAGFVASTYRSRYGIPGHAHGHDEDHDDLSPGARLFKDDDDEHEHEDEESIVLDLRQNRFDAKAGIYRPFAGFESLDARLAYNDYRHFEIALEEDGGEDIETEFYNRAWEGRAELVHAPFNGWRGAIGVQYARRDFEAIGDEAFVPPSVTRDLGVFVIEEKDFDPIKVELGARLDEQRIRPDGDERVRHSLVSLSAGAIWRLDEQWHVSLGLDRAQRAPSAEELFSDGPHIATQSVEIGNPDLERESANQVEVGLHYHGPRLEARVNAYVNRFDDFIYLADTGLEDEGLPVRLWSQADARFKGFEAETWILLADQDSGTWRLRLMTDTVRASLRRGGDLPRIAPRRLGAGLHWNRDGWRASINAISYATQTRVAEFEDETDGYTLVNANLSYRFSGRYDWELFLDGRNLTDREARVHTSFLKEQAPLPGRGIAFGVRAWF